MSWEMPYCYVGQVVWYYKAAPYTKPMAADVVAVGENTVNLLVKIPNRGLLNTSGTRHKNDPALVNENLREPGVWEHIPNAVIAPASQTKPVKQAS